jgi:hypothetical protein
VVLNDEQILYAAADAFYGLLLFRVLTALRGVDVTSATKAHKSDSSLPTSSVSLERHTSSISALVGLPSILYEYDQWPLSSSSSSSSSSVSSLTLTSAFTNDVWRPLAAANGATLFHVYGSYIDVSVQKQGHSSSSSEKKRASTKVSSKDTSNSGYQRRQLASVTKHVYENCKMLSPGTML